MKINVDSKVFNNMCAQFAHFGMAATIVFTGALTFHAHFIFVICGLLAWATVKEFWFDPHFETGGEGSGAKHGGPDIEDFCFYIFGAAFALVILLLHGRIL